MMFARYPRSKFGIRVRCGGARREMGDAMVDPNNPSGALPGDPRHGLSAEELRRYYREKAPSWLIHAALGPDGPAIRAAEAEPHMAYIRAAREQIRFSGPLLSDDGDAVRGSLTLLDAPDRAGAEAWIADEPVNKEGAFDAVTITRWSSSMEIRQADYARTAGWQQFAITALDGPDGAARRRAVAAEHHKYQASVMDRYVARGPLQPDDGDGVAGSFMIAEFPDRAAFDAFWAGEPLNYGGVFADVTIERWRYGRSLG